MLMLNRLSPIKSALINGHAVTHFCRKPIEIGINADINTFKGAQQSFLKRTVPASSCDYILAILSINATRLKQNIHKS